MDGWIDNWFFTSSQPRMSYRDDSNVIKKTRSKNKSYYLHHTIVKTSRVTNKIHIIKINKTVLVYKTYARWFILSTKFPTFYRYCIAYEQTECHHWSASQSSSGYPLHIFRMNKVPSKLSLAHSWDQPLQILYCVWTKGVLRSSFTDIAYEQMVVSKSSLAHFAM